MTTDPKSFPTQVEALQRLFCREHGAEYVPAHGESKSGFASCTEGLTPINGLRHPVVGETTGWYIWRGEEFSKAADFFEPVHTKHVYESHPELTKLLGLPPGYRFLWAGDYLDVWFDPSLLEV
jgi:hypothetical protein